MRTFITLIIFISASCVTTNNSYKTYKKYLSDEEKVELKQKKVINKTHTSYRKNGEIHWTGPLKVEFKNGKYQFTQHGVWKGYYETGNLFSEAVINQNGQTVHEKLFEEDGVQMAEIIGYDEPDNGKIVRREKIISYYSNQDTLNITTYIVRGEKSIKDGTEIFFDENGDVIKKLVFKEGKEIKH